MVQLQQFQTMNRVRIVKRDYQKILKGLPQDNPPNIQNRYALNQHERSPQDHRTICYTMGVSREKPLNTSTHQHGVNNILNGKQLFKKHALNERLFGEESGSQEIYADRQLKSYKRPTEDYKRIKTLQRSIQLYNSHEEKSDKLRKKDMRILPNARKDSTKCSPYIKKLNRQSLNVSRERTKTNLQSSNKMMRHHIMQDEQPIYDFKTGTMSEMKFVDRKGPSSRLREDQLLQKGKTAYQQNKYAQAIDSLSHLLSRNPSHLQANYLMAVSLMGRNEFAKAMRYFENILQIDPLYNKNVFILYAISCKKLSLHEQSIKKLSSCIQLFPDYYDAYIYRGKLRLKQKKFSQAITDFVKSNDINPDKSHGYLGLADCFYSMKQDQKAYDMYSKAFKLDPSLANTQVCLKMVNCLKTLSRIEEALGLVNEYLSVFSSNGEALILKGSLFLQQKKYNQAIMTLDQAIKLGDKKLNTKALQLMIKARICERDFYSAYHLIERIEFLDVDKSLLQKIKMFTEAVLFLMKRKFSQSIQIFQDIAGKYKNMLTAQDPSDQLDYFLKPLFHLYSAYGYFCLSDYHKSRQQYINYQQTLKARGKEQKIMESSTYNRIICQALLCYESQLYDQAIDQLRRATSIYQNKVEPYIYEGIINIQKHFQNQDQPQSQYLTKAIDMFTRGIQVMGDASNNIISNVFYHRAVVYAYTSSWNEAINDIDKAIEKSEDNIPKYFYLRGLIFACCQSFKQSIHDLSVCITLNENFAEGFLLRSKCLQIEGEANEAFVDLQRYISRHHNTHRIALKPEDPFIHKYAGHLLFQNGAFEDSILAYAHGEVIPDRDIDIFLTRGKAYFLLGEFSKSYQDLKMVWQSAKSQQIKVDLDVIEVLRQLKQQSAGCYELTINSMSKIIEDKACEGKIFKIKEFHMLKGGAYLYKGQYKQALLQFGECMALRQSGTKVYTEEDQQDADEAEQMNAYLNHMRFNMCLCYVMLGDFQRAKQMCNKCTIQKQKTTLQLLLCAIKYQLGESIQPEEKEATIEVEQLEIFSLKNKLSRHLKALSPNFKLNPNLVIRPCFSFPKVQPPEITPEFDKSIILNIDPSNIQNKPQAPWIRRAENSCIMFTSNIQVFDNLDLQTEQKTKRNQDQSRDYPSAVQIQNQFYKPTLEVSEISRGDIEKIKEKLKLEGDIEKKLNRLIQKKN